MYSMCVIMDLSNIRHDFAQMCPGEENGYSMRDLVSLGLVEQEISFKMIPNML